MKDRSGISFVVVVAVFIFVLFCRLLLIVALVVLVAAVVVVAVVVVVVVAVAVVVATITFLPTQATGAEERPRSSKFRAAGTTFRKKIALSRRRRDG